MRAVTQLCLALVGLMLFTNCRAPTREHGNFTLSWTNNLLTVVSPDLPSGKLEIWYLEAFCRPGAHDQNWNLTKIPHRTRLVFASPDRKRLQFETTVQPNVLVKHEVIAEVDSVKFTYAMKNKGSEFAHIQWFQPACIRVADFTGCNQQTYTGKSFLFTEHGLTRLSDTARTTNALYLGGQVYLPKQTLVSDANPRPVCRDSVTNGLIGCFSADDRQILATASSTTHELFEGVYVCLHSDPRIDGLRPGESKRFTSHLYLLPNDPDLLLKRYRRDFAGPP